MAKFTLRNSGLFVGETNLGPMCRTLSLELGTEIKDCTTFECSAREKLPGFIDVKGGGEGFWETGPDTLDPDLMNHFATNQDRPMTFTPEGNTAGNRAMIFQGVHANYNFLGAVGEVTPFTLDLEGTTRCLSGTILHKGIVTGADDGLALNLGTVSADQSVYATLHLYDVDAVTGWIVYVESDDNENFTSPITRVTFSGATDRVGVWGTPAAGPITDNWWHISWVITGTAAGIAVAMAIA